MCSNKMNGGGPQGVSAAYVDKNLSDFIKKKNSLLESESVYALKIFPTFRRNLTRPYSTLNTDAAHYFEI